jgi:hypothetical protein
MFAFSTALTEAASISTKAPCSSVMESGSL